MLKTVVTLAACAAIVVSGYVHGIWTERWGKGEEPTRLAARMAELPLQIGEWEGEDTAQKASTLDRELSGSIQRRYTHVPTGQSVTIALLCGRPGPICIHTPDVCYGASGYEVGKPAVIDAPAGDGKFWTADAVRTRSTETSRLRIFWAWSHDGRWAAVKDPRSAFAGEAALVKLYVLRDLTGANEKVEDDLCLRFLQAFIPEAQAGLFSSPPSE